jgi:hypothetical protein
MTIVEQKALAPMTSQIAHLAESVNPGKGEVGTDNPAPQAAAAVPATPRITMNRRMTPPLGQTR